MRKIAFSTIMSLVFLVSPAAKAEEPAKSIFGEHVVDDVALTGIAASAGIGAVTESRAQLVTRMVTKLVVNHRDNPAVLSEDDIAKVINAVRKSPGFFGPMGGMGDVSFGKLEVELDGGHLERQQRIANTHAYGDAKLGTVVQNLQGNRAAPSTVMMPMSPTGPNGLEVAGTAALSDVDKATESFAPKWEKKVIDIHQHVEKVPAAEIITEGGKGVTAKGKSLGSLEAMLRGYAEQGVKVKSITLWGIGNQAVRAGAQKALTGVAVGVGGTELIRVGIGAYEYYSAGDIVDSGIEKAAELFNSGAELYREVTGSEASSQSEGKK
ncbi:MAG: hypothetical protein AB1540_09710 [Bdellovibrionota bacterium]